MDNDAILQRLSYLEHHVPELEEKIADMEAQRDFVGARLRDLRAEIRAARDEVLRRREALRMYSDVELSPEFVVLEHLRQLRAFSPGTAVTSFTAVSLISVREHRRLSSGRARGIMERLMAQGLARKVGHTRATRYYAVDSPPPRDDA